MHPKRAEQPPEGLALPDQNACTNAQQSGWQLKLLQPLKTD